MLTQNLKFSFRNFSRNKSFSSLNIIGLSISLTAFILMALYIENELSFDKFHKKSARIYRVVDDKKTTDLMLLSAATAAPVGPALQHDFPEIEATARLIKTEGLVKNDVHQFEERSIYYADPGFFKIFSFDLIDGSATEALTNTSSIVLTASKAKQYFGSIQVVGNTLSINGKMMKVTGVIKDPPSNSHLKFDFLISMTTAEQKGSGYDWLFTNWYSNNGYTYLLLPEGYDPKKLISKFTEFDKRHDEPGDNTIHHYNLEKLTDIYLRSSRPDQAGATGSLINLYIFSAIAIFILVLACINFINLSTASAMKRAREVGIKKVVGATKGQLVNQFLTESFLIVALSLALSLLVSSILLPAFNRFSEKALELDLTSSRHSVAIIIILVVVSILSGIYPAFVLSHFKPAVTLKGNRNVSIWSISLRKSLVVFQFAVSVFLIVCSVVVYLQMNFLRDQDLGFRTSQKLVINFEGDQDIQRNINYIQSELMKVPGVKNISASSSVPGDGKAGTWSMDFAIRGSDTIHTELPVYIIDYNFLGQFGIPVVSGRALSVEYPADSLTSILINETALTKLGFMKAEDAIGINVGMYPTDGRIVGVVKDFHFESLQKRIEPLLMRAFPSQLRLLTLEIGEKNLAKTISGIDGKWKLIAPDRPLEYNFLDDTFNKQYESDLRFGKVFGIFTFLAVFIACLGLWGLASISTIQRTKEIGIRKLLGANVLNLSVLLSSHFIQLVILAIVIASPISWLLMEHWLQDFAYRIKISPWIFISAGLGSILLALLTVSVHTIRVAISNPITSLKSE